MNPFVDSKNFLYDLTSQTITKWFLFGSQTHTHIYTYTYTYRYRYSLYSVTISRNNIRFQSRDIRCRRSIVINLIKIIVIFGSQTTTTSALKCSRLTMDSILCQFQKMLSTVIQMRNPVSDPKIRKLWLSVYQSFQWQPPTFKFRRKTLPFGSDTSIPVKFGWLNTDRRTTWSQHPI